MEGVPRLYMIGLPAKYCANDRKPDFTSTINYHIRKSYDRDPSLYSADIDTLQELRLSAIEAVMSPVCTVNECIVLKRYYAHLVRLVDKFPRLLQQQDSVDEVKMAGPTPMLTFTWKRALGGKINSQRQMRNTDADVDIGDIGYEMRCILYNIGAAHSRLAAAQDRSPPLVSSSTSATAETESSSNTALKIACTHLQCAAWAFQQLLGGCEKNSEHPKWHHRQKPFVTTRALLEFAYNVTLAQAQECILEKSMMDGRKPLIIAKVSAMICEYFAATVDAVRRVECESSCVSVKRLEKWRLYSEFKCRYYGAITALFQGQHAQDQLQQMGTRVSYYRRAVNLLGRAGQISESGIKLASITEDYDSADDDYYYYLDSKDRGPGSGSSATAKEFEMRNDTLSFAMDVAAAKWRAAKSENELIYHEHVVPVLSDDDDSDCLGNNSSSKTGTHGRQLDRVKGASLVKPIGFVVDDPELLAITITIHNKGLNLSTTTTTTTLFKDLVPAATRHRAAIYRTEKCNMESEVRSMCQTADDQLTTFMDTLHLECLEMYKGESSYDGNEKNNVAELPQQLINCCATYQAMLQQKQQERESSLTSPEEMDQLDIDMARLSSAVQAVDSMLDEIDQLLKTEEQGNSEYQRTVGQPFDYSIVRMRELRREASRYREAHSGRARDSWMTLSQAVQNRRRRDLELLALPPDELAARLPPTRPMRSAIAAEVAAIGAMDSSSSFEVASHSEDQNNDSKTDENNGGRLRQLQRESIERLDRLNMVVEKMQEVKEQRRALLARLRGEMDKEDRNAVAAGQDDADILGESRGSEEDITVVVKKKLNDLYGNLVNLIERNVAAQVKVLDAVRTAYARTAPERRAYANAIQRRQTVVSSLLEAYENYMIANGGMSSTTNDETMTTSPINGILADEILSERCAKGLDFYQRMLTNVSKLLQRVKGACQVQNEQRDQIIKLHHQQWDTTLDDNQATPVDLSYQDHHIKDDMTSLIKSLDGANKHYTPLTSNWEQHHQQHDSRRLSPLGSEEQEHIYHYKFHDNEIMPPKSTNKMTIGNDYYGYYSDDGPPDSDIDDDLHMLNTVQQQQQPVVIPSILATKNTYPTDVNSTVLTSTLTSPLMPSSSSNLYNYYNSRLPTTNSFSINPMVSSLSRPNQISSAVTGTNDFTTTAMISALSLKNTNGTSNNKLISSYSPNNSNSSGKNSMNGDDDTTGGFTNAKAAVAVLQRPLPSPYISGSVAIGRGFGNINNTGIGYGTVTASGAYRPDLPIIQSQRSQQVQSQQQLQQQPQQQLQQKPQQQLQQQPQQQLQQQSQQQKPQYKFYQQQFHQPRLTATTVTVGSTTSLETTGAFMQQQHQLIARGLASSVQSMLPLSSTSISTTSMNNRCNITATVQSPSSQSISTGAEFFPRLTSVQQQPQQQLQMYQQQQQQPQLYQQQPQVFQQQPQITQQQSQLFQQQPLITQQQSQLFQQQQQQHSQQQFQPQSQQNVQLYQPEIYQQDMGLQLTTNGGNTSGNFYYQSQQQQTSQMYHPQHQQQLQSTAILTTIPVTSNNPLQSMSLSNTNTGSSNYYQQLQQCYPPTTITTTTTAATAVSLNTTTATTPNSYCYQQPSVATMTYNNQQQQYYHQQQQLSNVYSSSTTIPSTSGFIPTVNLLDDDLLLSGPPPIQPEKIGNFNVTTTSS